MPASHVSVEEQVSSILPAIWSAAGSSATAVEKEHLINILKELDSKISVDSLLERLLEHINALLRDENSAPLGHDYEDITAEDQQRIHDHYRSEFVKTVTESGGGIDSQGALSKLSDARRQILESFDADLERTFGIFATSSKQLQANHKSTSVSTVPASTSASMASPSANEAKMVAGEVVGKTPVAAGLESGEKPRGRKRKALPSASSLAAPLTEDFQADDGIEVVPYSPVKRRVSVTGTTTSGHFKASDVLVALLSDLLYVKNEIITVDSVLSGLFAAASPQSDAMDTRDENDTVGPVKAPSILQLVWKRADVARSDAPHTMPVALDSSVNLSRTIMKISTEYLRIYQQGLDNYDSQRYHTFRESYDRYRRRWEALTSTPFSFDTSAPINGKAPRLNLQDVPLACDRVPNPFSSLGGDYSQWTWLRNIFHEDQDDSDDASHDSHVHDAQPLPSTRSKLDFASCEVRELQDLAKHMLDTILHTSLERPMSFFESVRRCASLLAKGLNFVLVDKPIIINTAADANPHQERVEATIHRALITSTVLTVFHGALKPAHVPRKHRELASFVEKLRQTFLPQHLNSGATTGAGGHAPVSNNASSSAVVAANHASAASWGPILIVTKLPDCDAWEAGCREIFRDFQLEVMPYYGSDSDRIAFRGYLRALSSTSAGGLNYVGSGLYCDRSHLHVIVTNYETLLLDAHFFKDILWYATIYDEPWGFLSNERYHNARNQIFAMLKSRHRLLVCSTLTSPTTVVSPTTGSTTTSPIKQEGSSSTGPAASNVTYDRRHVAAYQMPDLLAILTVLCPFALGLSFQHDADQIYTTHHLSHLLNQQHYPLSTPFNNVKGKKPSGLPVKTGTHHSAEYLEVDGLTSYYLTRLLASATTVSYFTPLHTLMAEEAARSALSVPSSLPSSSISQTAPSPLLPPYGSLSQSITDAAVFDRFFTMYEHFYQAVPLLLWYGMEFQVQRPGTEDSQAVGIESTNAETSSTAASTRTQPAYQHVYQLSMDGLQETSDNKNNLSSNLSLVLVSQDYAHNLLYTESDFDLEVQQVNLKVVGQSGSGLARLVAVEPAAGSGTGGRTAQSGEPREDGDVNEESLPQPGSAVKGKSLPGRPRGKGRGKLAKTASSTAFSLTSLEEAAMGERAILPPIKSEGIAAQDTGMDVDGDGDDSEGEVDHRDDLLPQSARKSDSGRKAEDVDDIIGSTVSSTTTPATKRIKMEHEAGHAEMTSPDATTGGMQLKPLTSGVPVIGVESPAYMEELGKSMVRRAPFYHVHIAQTQPQTRNRFLGVYSGTGQAMAVFQAAYEQRENGALTTTAGGLSADRMSSMQQLKAKVSKDIKLTDGSFINDDYYKLVTPDDEDLWSDLRCMSWPHTIALASSSSSSTQVATNTKGAASNHSFNVWTSWTSILQLLVGLQYETPSYGLLRSADGSSQIYLPSCQVILGRATTRMLDQFLPSITSTSLPTSGSESDVSVKTSDIKDLMEGLVVSYATPAHIPVLHLGHDASLARNHLRIAYNNLFQCFEVFALQESDVASVYVNGRAVTPGNSPMLLPQRSIVQLGGRVYIFSLPRRSVDRSTVVDTFRLRAQLLEYLLVTRGWRHGALPPIPPAALEHVPGNDDAQGASSAAETTAAFEWDDDKIAAAVEAAEVNAVKGVWYHHA